MRMQKFKECGWAEKVIFIDLCQARWTGSGQAPITHAKCLPTWQDSDTGINFILR